MFEVNHDTLDITMHRGDTGSFTVTARKKSGAEWSAEDRMIFSVTDSMGVCRLARYYRLDSGRTSVSLDPGVVLIEFHNDDTDDWTAGQYKMELRFDIAPVWEGTAPTDDCVDALNCSAHPVEGGVVRTKIQSNVNIQSVYWEV